MNSNSTIHVTDSPTKLEERFLEVIQEATHIRRHAQLFTWLQGDMQSLLPHDVLLLADGDFSANGKLHYDVISAIHGVRTMGFSHADLEDLIRGLRERWVSHGCMAYVLDASSGVILNSTCQCNLHRALRSMRSLLVHGMYDQRSGRHVLYIAFRRSAQFEPDSQRLFEILLPHIDCAARRITALPDDDAQAETKGSSTSEFAPLTERESEILHWVGNGKTNYEIGIILSISPFTVKNHLQRIFRKIDVSNRAQAVLRFETLNRQRQ